MSYSYTIEERLGVLSDDGRYTVEVNMIAHNGARPKLDIRKWDRKEGKMLKGIALNREETEKLEEILQEVSRADFR
ncbi:MAG: hypothetical protein IJ600_03390 [Lachnospiraceae bacterium]|nr:hypothetical protein [Lachnospiraceae bacterium]